MHSYFSLSGETWPVSRHGEQPFSSSEEHLCCSLGVNRPCQPPSPRWVLRQLRPHRLSAENPPRASPSSEEKPFVMWSLLPVYPPPHKACPLSPHSQYALASQGRFRPQGLCTALPFAWNVLPQMSIWPTTTEAFAQMLPPQWHLSWPPDLSFQPPPSPTPACSRSCPCLIFTPQHVTLSNIFYFLSLLAVTTQYSSSSTVEERRASLGGGTTCHCD